MPNFAQVSDQRFNRCLIRGAGMRWREPTMAPSNGSVAVRIFTPREPGGTSTSGSFAGKKLEDRREIQKLGGVAEIWAIAVKEIRRRSELPAN